MSLDTLEWVRGTVWLYPCHPSAKEALISAKTYLPSPVIYPEGVRDSMRMSTSFPDGVEYFHFSLTPFSVLNLGAPKLGWVGEKSL